MMTNREKADMDAYITRGPAEHDEGENCGVCEANGDASISPVEVNMDGREYLAEDDTPTCEWHKAWVRCGNHYRALNDECDVCETPAPDALLPPEPTPTPTPSARCILISLPPANPVTMTAMAHAHAIYIHGMTTAQARGIAAEFIAWADKEDATDAR